MSATVTSFPAKLLLFGEHTVLRGGRGLAVPYPARSLRWTRDRPDERLLRFADYLKVALSDLIDGDRLEDDLLADWCLTGNIPAGYGLGSSGAVCAAVWSRYGTARAASLEGAALRDALARMEQHFHGQSSGTDPLVAYLQRPLLLGTDRGPVLVDPPENWARQLFLVDTGRERKTGNLIRKFLDLYDGQADAATAIDREWREVADAAIGALLEGDRTALRTAFRRLSAAQLRYFPAAIPRALRMVWDGGDAYALKLCGAGGGGMLLGLADDRAATQGRFGERLTWLDGPT